ncbi:MAG: phospholipid carrier-dependent glycosyltransferase, partial [Candidatus Caenarcaniphilales bacterium]|nr:phospholipid carrier-dependent glycosyltransferase [Candidatus Caenarcaniphilales bacterium]
MNKIFFTIVFLTAVCFYSLANNCFPLISPDEPRYAETAREMIESGNLITPYCDYQLRFDKPILFYWLESLSLKAFGLNEFAARLPSVFAGAGLIWLAFLLANLHGYAISASLILLTNFAMLVFSRLAVTDMLLNFFISASLV